MSKTITKIKKNVFNVPEKENQLCALEKNIFEPSENVIQNILNYSKALSIHKLRSDVYVEMLLN